MTPEPVPILLALPLPAKFAVMAGLLILPGLGAAGLFARLQNEFESRASFLQTLIVALLVSVLELSLLALSLFAFEIWSERRFLAGAALLTALQVSLFRALLHKRPVSLPVNLRPRELGMAAIALALAVFFWERPSVWMTYYNYDAGRYSNIASFMLRTGGIKADPAGLGSNLQGSDFDFPRYFYDDPPLDHFPLPYLHLFPSQLAAVRQAAGLEGSFRINQELGVVAAFALFLLLRLYGLRPAWAGCGALFLYLNPAFQFYQTRLMAEMSALVLSLGMFAFLCIAERCESRAFSLLTVLSLFGLAACRLEYGFVFSFLPLALLVFRCCLAGTRGEPAATWRPGRSIRWIVYSNAALLIPLYGYYSRYAKNYIFRNTFWHLDNLSDAAGIPVRVESDFPIVALLFALNAAAVICSLMLLKLQSAAGTADRSSSGFLPAFFPLSRKAGNALVTAAVSALCLLLLWAWMARPAAYFDIGRKDFSFDISRQFNLPRLLYFIDPATILLGALGLVQLFRRPKAAPLAILAVGSLVVAIFNNYHSPVTFGWVRRFLPVVIPGFYCLALLTLESFRSKKILGALIAFILVFNSAVTVESFRGNRENPEAVAFFRDTAAALPPNALLVTFNGVDSNVVAVPLHAHFGVPTLYLSRGLNARKVSFIRKSIDAGKRVVVVESSASAAPLSESDLALFRQAGLIVRPFRTGTHTIVAYESFCREWLPGRPLSQLFLPPGLFGACDRRLTFRYRLSEIRGAFEQPETLLQKIADH